MNFTIGTLSWLQLPEEQIGCQLAIVVVIHLGGEGGLVDPGDGGGKNPGPGIQPTQPR